MEEVIGLLIEFDTATGRRAGDINPKDIGLRCYGWQNLYEEDVTAKGYTWESDIPPGRRALEIRIIVDGRDVSPYEGIPGVTILRGATEINTTLDKYFVQYRYSPPTIIGEAVLFVEALKEKGIAISELDLSTPLKAQETLKRLFEVEGIRVIKKLKVFEKLPET